MSLTFRSVKKISRKKRKSGSKTKTKKNFRDPFEDNPLKFTVEDEESNSDFPTLNSVYKTEIFGTPVTFKNGYGSDCMKFLKIKTRLQSIIFMNEYVNKSFEELRWEDYQSNRKGSQIFEEMNYLKCLSKETETSKWKTILPPKKFEFIEPVSKNVFGKFPALTKQNAAMDKERIDRGTPEKTILPKIKEENAEMPKEMFLRSSKERSILTNVDKYQPKDNNCIKELDAERKQKSVFRTSSEINIKSNKEEMIKENLQRYFSCAYSNASVPYDFFPQNNNYYLPCTNISLAYKNTNHSKFSKKSPPAYLWEALKTNPFGYNSIFDKLDPVVEKESLYGKLFGVQNNRKIRKEFIKKSVVKYTSENRFSKRYFWSKFSPYHCNERSVFSRPYREKPFGVEKFTKTKNFWMGLDVVS